MHVFEVFNIFILKMVGNSDTVHYPEYNLHYTVHFHGDSFTTW